MLRDWGHSTGWPEDRRCRGRKTKASELIRLRLKRSAPLERLLVESEKAEEGRNRIIGRRALAFPVVRFSEPEYQGHD